MHVPQSYETKAEMKELMYVPRQIVTPQKSGPIMGLVQDSLLGVMLISKRNVFLTREEVMHVAMYIEEFNLELPIPVREY